MRRPPSRTHGILPDVRQLNNVRRLIGNFASSCFSLMKPSPLDGVCFGSLFMAAFSQIAGVALCHFRTGLISASVILNNFCPDLFHGDIFADCQAALRNGLHDFDSGFFYSERFFSWRHFPTLTKPLCSFSKQNEFRLFPILNDLQITIQSHSVWIVRLARVREEIGQTKISLLCDLKCHAAKSKTHPVRYTEPSRKASYSAANNTKQALPLNKLRFLCFV